MNSSDASLSASQMLSEAATGSSPSRFSMPGPALWVAAGTTAAIGYALYEQIRFRMARQGKQGTVLPGERCP